MHKRLIVRTAFDGDQVARCHILAISNACGAEKRGTEVDANGRWRDAVTAHCGRDDGDREKYQNGKKGVPKENHSCCMPRVPGIPVLEKLVIRIDVAGYRLFVEIERCGKQTLYIYLRDSPFSI